MKINYKAALTLIIFSIFILPAFSADYYWVGGSGNWSDHNNHWATSSGGNTFYNQVPTETDNVFFDENSFSSNGQTVNLDADAYCFNMDWTGATNNPTLTGSREIRVFGDLIFISNMNYNATSKLYLEALSTGKTVNTAGKTIFEVYFNGQQTANGGWVLQSDLNVTNKIDFYGGALTTNGFDISCEKFFAYYNTAKSIDFSNSDTIRVGSEWRIYPNGTQTTLTPGNSTIYLDDEDIYYYYQVNFYGGNYTYNNVVLSRTSDETNEYYKTYGPYIHQNNTFNDVTFILGGERQGYIYSSNTFNTLKAVYVGQNNSLKSPRLNVNSNCTIGSLVTESNSDLTGEIRLYSSNTIGSINLDGKTNLVLNSYTQQTISSLTTNTACDSRVEIKTEDNAYSTATLNATSGTISTNWLTITDVVASGGATFNASNSIGLGTTTGWNISTPASNTYYWVGGTGYWNDDSHWSTTSGGSPSACGIPTILDNVVFDGNSFSTTGQSVTVNVNGACNNMDWSSVTNNPTLTGGQQITIGGSLSLSSNMGFSHTGAYKFISQTTNTIDLAGNTINEVNFSSNKNLNGQWTLVDDFNVSNDFYFQSGKLISNGKNLAAKNFYSTSGHSRDLDFTGSQYFKVFENWNYGSGQETLTIDTLTIQLHSNPSDRFRGMNFSGGGKTYYNLDINHTGLYGYNIYIQGTNTFNNVSYESNGVQYFILYQSNTINNLNVNFAGNYQTTQTPYISLQNTNTINNFTIQNTGIYQPELKVYNSNTIDTLTVDKGVELQLAANYTQTLKALNLNGACEAGISIKSTSTGSAGTISIATGTVNASYLTLQDNIVTGGATFNAIATIDNGNVSGWNITAKPAANYYWVGGTGSWTDPGHWSTSSGGAGGTCDIPSFQDNVFFDVNSFNSNSNSVTIDANSECRSMTWNNVYGNPNLICSYSNNLSVYGSMILDSNMNTNSFQGELYFDATTTGNLIDLKGNRLNRVRFRGSNTSTGEWNLLSDFKLSNDFYHDYGTINSNGHNIEAFSYWGGSGYPKNLNLTGSGTFNARYYWQMTSSSNTQFNAGNYKIYMDYGPYSYFYGGSRAYNDLEMILNYNYYNGNPYTSYLSDNNTFNNLIVDISSPQHLYIQGNNTFNDAQFNFTNNNSAANPEVKLYGTNTFNDFSSTSTGSYGPYFTFNQNNTFSSLTCAGVGTRLFLGAGKTQTTTNTLALGSGGFPVFLQSTVTGQQANLYQANGEVCLDFVWLKDINATGPATYNAGASSSDLGNNTNWTFSSCDAYYWVGGSGNWDDLSHWATSSGGSVNHIVLPSSDDNVFFDGNSFSATGQTVTVNVNNAACNNMSWLSSLYNPTFAGSTPSIAIHGSMNMIAAMDVTYSGSFNFMSNNSGNLINSGGNTLSQVNLLGSGEWMLTNNLNVTNSIDLQNGTLNTNNKNVSVNSFIASSTNSKALNLTNSNVNVYEGVWDAQGASTLSLTPGGSTIKLISNNGTVDFNGANQTYNNVIFTTPTFMASEMTGLNTFNKLRFEAGVTATLPVGNQNTTNLEIVGTCIKNVNLNSEQTGSLAGFVQASGTVNGSFVSLTDNAASGGATFNANLSIDNGNVPGWNFTQVDSLTLNIVVTNANCQSANDGTAAVNILTGKAPYTYAWSTTEITTSISGLIPGSYSVEVLDSNGCYAADTVTVTVPPSVSLTATSVDENCQGAADGSVTLTTNGGTSPFTYSNTATTGLVAGNYKYYVTDVNNCSDTVDVTINAGGVCNQLPTAVCANPTIAVGSNCTVTISASDIDGGSSDPDGDPLTYSISNAGPFAFGTHTVTLTVSDPSGETSSCTATLNVVDNTNPVAIAQNLTVQLDAQGNATITASQVDNGSSDSCGIASLSLDKTNFNCGNIGNNTVTLTVTDLGGNVSTASAIVEVQDNQAPTILLPSDVSVSCNQSTAPYTSIAGSANSTSQTTIAGSATATDNCSTPTITYSDSVVNGNCASSYTIYRVWTATDANSNTSSAIQTIQVQDNSAPNIIVPANVTLNCGDNIAPDSVCTTDDFQNSIKFNGSYQNASLGSWFNYQEFTISMWVKPGASQSTFANILDNNHDGVSNFVIQQNGSSLNQYYVYMNGDLVNFSLSTNAWQHLAVVRSSNFLAVYVNGSLVQSIVPVNPIYYSNPNLTIANHNVYGRYWNGELDELRVYNVAKSATSILAEASTLVPGNAPNLVAYYQMNSTGGSSIQDASNYNRTGSLGGSPTFQTSGAPSGMSNCSGFATAVDNCDLSPTISYSDAIIPGSCGGNYTINRTWTATDICGNVSSGVQTLTINGNQGPEVTCPSTVTVAAAPGACGANVTFAASASSDCGTPTISYSQQSGSYFPVGTTTVNVTANNSCGLSTSCSFNVVVTDTVDPVISCSPDTLYLSSNGTVQINTSNIATATDNCSISSLSSSITTLTTANVGNNVVTVTAIDPSGNSGSCQSNVYVIEPKPNAVCKDITIYLDGQGSASIIGPDIDNGSNSLVGISSLIAIPNSFNCTSVGANTVQLVATNSFGQTDTCTATVTVLDTIAPMASCQNLTVYLDENGSTSITANGGTSTITEFYDDFAGQTVNTSVYTNGTSLTVSQNDELIIQNPGNNFSDWSNRFHTSNQNFQRVDGKEFYYEFYYDNFNAAFIGWRWGYHGQFYYAHQDLAHAFYFNRVGIQVRETANGGPGYNQDITNSIPGGFSFQTWYECRIVLKSVGAEYYIRKKGQTNWYHAATTSTRTDNNLELAFYTYGDANNTYNAMKTDNWTVSIPGSGNAGPAVNNGSADNCDIASYSIDKSSFGCADVGTNTVTMAITDINGNTSTCTSTVTVVDTTSPLVLTQDLTIYLDAQGSAAITAQSVDNGSTDNCDIATLSVSPNTFGCSNLGENIVTLTVTDVNGNINTNNAVIIVVDSLNPIITTTNITISLDSLGNASIVEADVASATDNCGISSLTLDNYDFDCSNVDQSNPVVITALDNSGAGPLGTYSEHSGIQSFAQGQSTVLVAGDVDNDGKADIQVTNNFYKNNGTGTVFSNMGLGQNMPGAAMGDLDGDGDLDIINGSIVYLWNGSTMVYHQSLPLTGIIFNHAALADLDGDGDLDYYAPTYYQNDEQIFLNDGSGNFTLGNSYSQGSYQLCAAPGDMDNDGDQDMIVAGYYNVYLATNDGSANLTYSTIYSNGNNYIPAVRTSDFDNDGNIDVVLGIVTGTPIILFGNGDGTFQTPVSLNGTVSGSRGLKVADWEGDGDIDILQINTTNIVIWKNNGGIFQEELTGFTGFFDGAIADFNGDGVNDLAMTAPGQGKIALSDVGTPNSSTKTAYVTVEDNFPPTVFTQNLSIALDSSGNASIYPSDVNNNSFDACGIYSYTLDKSTFNCADVGDNTITLTVVDIHGNSNSATAIVTVSDTAVVPSALTQNIIAYLDASGNVSITPSMIDNGSTDACGIDSLALDVTQFDCSNVGQNTVNLTVWDVNNNSSTTPAIVTVEDTLRPIISGCSSDLLVNNLAGNCFQNVMWTMPTASDNCGVSSIVESNNGGILILPLGNGLKFGAFPVGSTEIKYTVTDVNGNVSICTFNVVVEDNEAPHLYGVPSAISVNNIPGTCGQHVTWSLPTVSDNCPNVMLSTNHNPGETFPVGVTKVVYNLMDPAGNSVSDSFNITVIDNELPNALSQSLTVYLDNQGDGSITTAMVNNGSTDNCGIDTMYLSGYDFTCAEVGVNNITLTVVDIHGNSNTSVASVTVMDTIVPVALVQNVTVQLDAQGNGSTTAQAVDNGSNDACGVSLSLDNTSFYCSNVGANTVTLTVTDNNGNVSTSTATVTVEDNVAPVALAQNVTVQLDAQGNGSTTAQAVDNGSIDACGVASLALSQTAFDCSHVGANTVTLTVTDVNGNVSTATATVTVEDNVAPVAIAQNVTVQLDAQGNGSTTAQAVNNGSNDACGVASLALSQTAFDCSHVGANTVTLTVTDNNGNVSTATATVTVEDNVAPVAIAQNITVQLDAQGNGSTTATAVDNGSNDACGVASLALSQTAFDCSHVGANTVTLTVTDNNGNVSTAQATVTVEDNVAPVTIAQNVTVQLDAQGNGSTTAQAVDNGSNDACGVASLALSQTAFDCSHVGANTVTLTVTDVNGNVSTAAATVTVEDNVAPVALAQNVTVQLDAQGNGSTTAQAVDNGSNDACGVASLALSQTAFDCSHVGANTVTLTVTDNNGNVSTATATVTVEDNVAPIALAQNVTVQLDAQGNGSTTATAVDNGSNDACGVASLALSQTAFDCSHVGANPVTLTVTDNNGNVSTATSTVTVEDNVAPAAIAQNVTVQLDAQGNGSTTAIAVDNGSNDACGVASLAISQTAFDCSHVGANTVTLTVTDVNGNVSTATATVTVEDNVAPVAIAQNVAVQLDSAGNGSTTAQAVDNGSNDACGVASLALSQTAFDCSHVGSNTVTLTVTDVNGNVSTATATVTVQDNIAPIISCPSNITVTAAPGYCNAKVNWNNPTIVESCSYTVVSSATSGSVFAIGITTVTYTVTDASNNTATCSFNVTVNPSPINLSVQVSTYNSGDNISCNGETDGSIDLVVTGGCAPYSFVWSNLATTEDISGLTAGVYEVSVTDNNNTTEVLSITLTEPSALIVDAGLDGEICLNDVFTLNGSAIGGSPTYSTSWTPNVALSNVNSLVVDASPATDASYILTVTDINGCVATDTAAVIVNPLPVAEISVEEQDWCNGLTLTGNGSTSNNLFNWSTGETNASIFVSSQNNNAGNIILNVTDLNGCTSLVADTFGYQPDFNLSSYTIIADEYVKLGDYNDVQSGSVGVRDNDGKAYLHNYSTLSSFGSFLKADKIYASSKVGNVNTISSPASGLNLPTMLYHSFSTKNYGKYKLKNNKTATYHGDYRDIEVEDNATLTLTGKYFGKIEVENDAELIFTSDTVYIEELDLEEGKRGMSKVTFAHDAVVIVKEEVKIEYNAVFNPTHQDVTVYVGSCENSSGKDGCYKGKDDDDDDDDDDKGKSSKYGKYSSKVKCYGGNFNVHAYNTTVNANVFAKGGEINVYKGSKRVRSFMNGVFIAEKVHSPATNVIWNGNDCSNTGNTLATKTSITYVNIPLEDDSVNENQLAANAPSLSIFPNPSNAEVNINLTSPSNEMVQLKIIDMAGNLVFQTSTYANQNYRVETDLASGVYFLELIQGNFKEIKRIVKH